jgi:hypothetical protein
MMTPRMKMTMPELGDVCHGCGDVFDGHWITHDGTRQGCLGVKVVGSEFVDKEATRTKRVEKACDCAGFSVAWTPEVTLPYGPLPPHEYSPEKTAYEPPTVEWERQS